MRRHILAILFVAIASIVYSQQILGTSLEMPLENYVYQSSHNSYINYDNRITLFPMYFRESMQIVINKLINSRNKEFYAIDEKEVAKNKAIITIDLYNSPLENTEFYLVSGDEKQTTVLCFHYYKKLTTAIQLFELLTSFINSKNVEPILSNDLLFEYSIKIPEKYRLLYIVGLRYSFDTEDQGGKPVLVIEYDPATHAGLSLSEIAYRDAIDVDNIDEKPFTGINSKYQYWLGLFTYRSSIIEKVVVRTSMTKSILFSRQIIDEDISIVEKELTEMVNSIEKKQ